MSAWVTQLMMTKIVDEFATKNIMSQNSINNSYVEYIF